MNLESQDYIWTSLSVGWRYLEDCIDTSEKEYVFQPTILAVHQNGMHFCICQLCHQPYKYVNYMVFI